VYLKQCLFVLKQCFHKFEKSIVSVRDAGTGVHYDGTAPLPFERGGNGGTGALT